MLSFISGGTTGETAESLRRKREVAEAMLARSTSRVARDPWEGIAQVGQALAGRYKAGKVDAAEKEAKDAASAQYAEIVAALGGGMAPGALAGSDRVGTPFVPPVSDARAAPAPFDPAAIDASLSDDLISRVIRQESGGNPDAVSPKGATGLMQIMPATARDPGFGLPDIFTLAQQMGRPAQGTDDATLQSLLRDADVNKAFGTRYLAAMLNRSGGDKAKALASYNAGPGAVDQYGGVPPFAETQNYVQAIMGDQPQIDSSPIQMVSSAMTERQPGGIDPRLMQLAGNEFLNDGQRSVVNALLQQQLASMSPREQTEFERLAQGLDPAQAERARMIRLGLEPDADTTLRVGASERGGFRQATPEEAAAYGASGGQFGPDGRFYPINPPSGMAIEMGPDGTTRVVQGPGATQKPFTEGQSKDVVYVTRAEGALETVEQYADALANLGDRALDYDPTGIARGAFQSPEFQVARASADEFLQAILRKDTGAAITAQEQDLYGTTYLPRPGDGPEVLAYKQEARRRAVEAIKAGMSPQQMIAQERALAATRGFDFGAKPTNVPDGVDPEDWEAMTPEERRLFQ